MSKVTLVTAYYDLPNLRRMSCEKYLEYGTQLLQTPINLIIFCDHSMKDRFYKIRESHNLLNRTLFLVRKLETLYFYQYRKKIVQNMNEYWPASEPPRHPDVHIVMLSKIAMLHEAIEIDYFHSDYYGWIDFGLFRLGPQITSEKILHICDHPRPKMTMMLIYPWKPEDYQDLRGWYSKYRWVIIGGFYTIEKTVSSFIIPKIVEESERVTLVGYGDGEEMIYAKIIDNYTDSFTLNIGYYEDVLDNYHYITTNANFITKLLDLYIDRHRFDLLSKIVNNL